MAAIQNYQDRTLKTAWTLANLDNLQNECCESYLAMVLTNPLSLKQLARIEIRNMLIEKMKDFDFVKAQLTPRTMLTTSAPNGPDSIRWATSPFSKESILATLITQLELPISLKRYLYEFPDVPPVPQDLDVYIQY